MMGDMNAVPECSEITEFVQDIKKIEWKDATDKLGGTYHAFGEHKTETQIDYIFSSLSYENSYCIRDVFGEGIYYSDHYPVCAEFDVDLI